MKAKLSLSSVIKSEKAKNYRLVNIQYGIPARTSIYKSNRVYSKQYAFLYLVPKTLFHEFQNISYFWFAFVVVLDFLSNDEAESWKMYPIVSFIILMVIIMISNFFRALWRHKANKMHNNLEAHVWEKTSFKNCKSESLVVGNVILVMDKEIVPADIILLSCRGKDTDMYANDEIFSNREDLNQDEIEFNFPQVKIRSDNTIRQGNLPNQSNKSQYAYLNMKKVLGNRELVVKKNIKNTEFIKETDPEIINGALKRMESIKVVAPSKSFSSFKGKIKFKGNPKACIVENDNFIIGGSKVALQP
ncbi:hypothetical protein SteCoe_16924 [Stentor coeruleus]|uniref:P-type ATPase N-terminal domain-containing protein n=1 Tax=Stentor coeruleus TaxID=5963 RepID=A0A1R2C056_9CILI|nr:hypothetical protein SteCoe_16924 [Stentor coeruleus]